MKSTSILKTVVLTASAFALILTASCTNRAASQTQTEKGLKTATFAGGCFWCMEPPFDKLKGIKKTISGYIGGKESNPTYQAVSSGRTGHTEAVQVTFDPKEVSYERLLETFWMQIDPTDSGGQFVDRGRHYRTGIFYHSDEQKRQAEESKKKLAASGRFTKPIVTEITKAGPFFAAEDYHQDYYQKNPLRYKYYRYRSGRDQYLSKIWGKSKNIGDQKPGRYRKPDQKILRRKLTPLQYRVTQKEGTEPPFKNEYWDNKAPGIYVDIVSGEPLFSSKDKFKSGTGWPSFTRPLETEHIVTRVDHHLFVPRTEVRSKFGDSHLGHVFEDGPPPTGLRYCINSAALRFIPAQKLKEEGYEQYAGLFK